MTRLSKVQSSMLMSCLTAPCLRQSNTPSHVVCCYGSKDPSHSVRKNIVLVAPPTPHPPAPPPPHTYRLHLPLQTSKLWSENFFHKFMSWWYNTWWHDSWEHSGTSWASASKTLFLKDSRSGMVFQITLTVIGRPKYYAAESHGVEIRIHLVLQNKQQHTYSPHYPSPDSSQPHLELYQSLKWDLRLS